MRSRCRLPISSELAELAELVATTGSPGVPAGRESTTEKMGIFANFTGTTQFYLARVPSSAAGQILNVRLFDVGDGATAGTITILKPAESTPASSTLSNCRATGSIAALNAALPTCALTVSSSNQGKWQNVAVPIPSTYQCSDVLTTGCWVMLKYDYSGSPADATSWTASIEGDPVRLVE
jgi:hypothetical protein